MTELYWWKKANLVDGRKVHRMRAMGVVASRGGPLGLMGRPGCCWDLWALEGYDGGPWGPLGVVAVGGFERPEG